MKKYRLTIKEQCFEYDNSRDLINKARSILELGIWVIKTEGIEEDLPKKIEEKEEFKVEPKKLIKAQKSLRNSKRERKSKYSHEMKEFIERHINQNSNKQLVKLVKGRFGLDFSVNKFTGYLQRNKLKREDPYFSRRKIKRDIEVDKSPKKSRNSKYSQEVVDYIKEHYYNIKRDKLIPQVNKMFGLNLNVDRFEALIKFKGISKKSCKKERSPGLDSNKAFEDDSDVDDLELDN